MNRRSPHASTTRRQHLASLGLQLTLLATFVASQLPVRWTSGGEPELAPLWSRTLGPAQGDSMVTSELVEELQDGTVLVVARDGWRPVLLRYGDDGRELSFARIQDFAWRSRVVVDPAGAVVISGSYPQRANRLAVAKYNASTGRQMWASPAVVPGHPVVSNDPLIPHALDREGNVLLVSVECVHWDERGRQCVSADWTVTKIVGQSGALAWSVPAEHEIAQPGAVPVAIAADVDGDVLLLCLMAGDDGCGRWTLYKLDSDSGRIAWGPRTVVAAPDGHSSPALMLPTDDGGVFVAGWMPREPWCSLAVARVDGRTGDLLWGPVEVPGYALQSQPPQLAVDHAANLLVLATSFLTKLDAATGHTLWTAAPGEDLPKSKYGSPGHATSFAPTTGDLIWVIGASPLGDFHKDQLVTAAYSSTSGRIVRAPQVQEAPQALGTNAGPAVVTRSGELVVSGGSVQMRHAPPALHYSLATQALDATTGKRLWGPISREAGSAGEGGQLPPLALGNGDLVVGNRDGGNLYRIRGTTGDVVWGPVTFADLGLTDWHAQLVGVASQSYLVLAGASPPLRGKPEIIVLDATTGAKLRVIGGVPTSGPSDYTMCDGLVTGDGAAVLVLAPPEPQEKDSWQEAAGGRPSVTYVAVSIDVATGRPRWGPVPLFEAQDAASWLCLESDTEGNVVAGSHLGTAGAAVVKLSSGSGERLWQEWLSPLGLTDLGVSPNGDVSVVGRWPTPNSTGGAWAVMQLHGDDGSPTWGPVVEALQDGQWTTLRPTALTVNSHGDVVVGGVAESYTSGVHACAVAIAMYRGHDGANVWGPLLDVLSPCVAAGSACATDYDQIGVRDDGTVSALLPVLTPGSDFVYAMLRNGATGELEWLTPQSGLGARPLPGRLYPTDNDWVLCTSIGSATLVQRLTSGLTFDWPHEWLPPATTGSVYRFPLGARNAKGSATFFLVEGWLPEGLVLDPRTGILRGEARTVGSWEFAIEVVDGFGNRTRRRFVVDTVPPVAPASRELPARSSADRGGLYSPLRCLP